MDNIFIKYEQALRILEEHATSFPAERRALEKCRGAYLDEELIADRDFPPFDRVTMDGIAINYASFKRGRRRFRIEATSPAGTPKQTLLNPDNCIEVMTGTVVPENADTVIRYEDVNISKGEATIKINDVKHRQSIHFKGIDIPEGATIVKKGMQLSSAEINIAAAIGKSSLLVKKLPRAVVFSTGDELINIDQLPEEHQIRRSNIYGIRNSLEEWHINTELAHLPDNKSEMSTIISEYLKTHDLFLFTGGVSKGKYDFLPDVLDDLSITRHFHKIQQRPGKPFWFGSDPNGKMIFALPGNPVSSFVCLYRYFRFWLLKSLGQKENILYVKLTENVEFRPDLVYFLEGILKSEADGSLYVTPVPGNGSGDFANLVRTDGFLVLPQELTTFKKGEIYPFIAYRYMFG